MIGYIIQFMFYLSITCIHPLENNSSSVTVLDVGERGSTIDNTCYYLYLFCRSKIKLCFSDVSMIDCTNQSAAFCV